MLKNEYKKLVIKILIWSVSILSCLISQFIYDKVWRLNIEYMYTVLHIFRQVLFWAWNHGNHQNFEKIDTSYKRFFSLEKKNIFKKKKFKMADSKKPSFSKSPILNIFLWKFHGLVLGLVGLIDAKGIDLAQPIWPWGCRT